MARYIVFDVETPNRYNNRISAIGISVVENAKIIKEYFYFVNPGQRFDWFNTQLTGISAELVADAPTFPQLWKVIEPVMSSGILVAHNASFDMGVIRKCLRDYGIAWKPQVRGLCTVVMGRRLCPGISHRLNDLCDYYGICRNRKSLCEYIICGEKRKPQPVFIYQNKLRLCAMVFAKTNVMRHERIAFLKKQ